MVELSSLFPLPSLVKITEKNLGAPPLFFHLAFASLLLSHWQIVHLTYYLLIDKKQKCNWTLFITIPLSSHEKRAALRHILFNFKEKEIKYICHRTRKKEKWQLIYCLDLCCHVIGRTQSENKLTDFICFLY